MKFISLLILILINLSSCTHQKSVNTPENIVKLQCENLLIHSDRAIIDPPCVTSSIKFAKQLNDREGLKLPEGEKWFEVIEGSTPVVITAPHSTRPLRNGKRRFSDGGGTAALAVAIAQITGATIIYTSYEGPSDPNYYDDNRLKEKLKQIIETLHPKYVLDLHGSHSYRSYDIDLGTMDGKSLLGNEKLLKRLIEQFHKDGITSISHNRFSASKAQTITKFSSNHGVPAIQLEINATWVSPGNSNIEAQRYSKLLQSLARFINFTK